MAPTDRRLFCLFISTLVICCMHRTSTQAQTVRVRLEGGPNSYSGRVVVIRNGIPGTICDDAFGNTDAQVICRMLGFDPSTRIGIRSLSNMYGPGTGRIWVDELGCLGYETSITQCRRNSWGVHDCSHSEDVSITCGTPIGGCPRSLEASGPDEGAWSTTREPLWTGQDHLPAPEELLLAPVPEEYVFSLQSRAPCLGRKAPLTPGGIQEGMYQWAPRWSGL